MSKRFASRAEELRHHRKCFELALELHCTPKEAEEVLAKIEAREKYRALCIKHRRPACPPPLQLPTSRAEFERFDAPWMMRD